MRACVPVARRDPALTHLGAHRFNWAARKLVRRLGQLGATAFLDLCEADEQFPDGCVPPTSTPRLSLCES